MLYSPQNVFARRSRLERNVGAMKPMQRVVVILESVARSATPTTPARVSEETQFSLSTVSRIMRELAAEQMLDRGSDGTYLLGTRVFGLVSHAATKGDRSTAIGRVLQELRDLTGETASIHVRRADQRVCIAAANSRNELRRVVAIGDSMNMVGTVPGDILLSQLPESEQDEIISAVLFGRERAIQRERVRLACETGYSAHSAEGFGITGVAVPIFIEDRIGAALAVSGPTTRFSVETAESWVPDLRNAAERISPWMQPD